MNLKSFFNKSFIVLSLAFVLMGCSDEFLQNKQDFSNTNSIIYNNYTGAKGRVDNIYALNVPRSNQNVSAIYPSTGNADDYATSTEEYGGLSIYVDINPLTNSTVPDFFYVESKTSTSPYGRIRSCNDAINGISNGTLTDDQKKELLGQVYFFRAWVYYRLVKVYGGVPIVDHVQNPVIGDTLTLRIPRATTKECVDFICKDLETAASYLPSKWNDANWGRVTSGAALALAARVRLLYASPLFNREDNKARWDSAYNVSKHAIETLQSSNFYKLAYADAPGVNASGWAKMFSDYQSPEAVFVTLYNNVKEAGSSAINFNNTWEQAIRPINTRGGGGRSATSQMVDMFPMANGTPALDKSWQPINQYDPALFFKNRDPRFYRTFAFTGVEWKFNGNPIIDAKDTTLYPYNGTAYKLWNYAWYVDASKRDNEQLSGYGTDGMATNYKGVYIRKRTDDYGVNPSNTLYVYDLTVSNPFVWSAAPYMEIRYAEVLLNFAEAACGAGHGDEALAALRQIRMRVGYTGTCGLDDALASDRAKLFAAILYERQIELAYEGKRFDDMRRWMLWDGGVGQAAINPSWELKGFGGNTCTYLDVEPLNGKRRTGFEMRVATTTATANGLGAEAPAGDPIKKNLRPAAIDLSKTLSTQTAALELFYNTYLTRKQRLVDTQGRTINFLPRYYFLGLRSSAQLNNNTLKQTIGWEDSQTGGMGTFDPLAE